MAQRFTGTRKCDKLEKNRPLTSDISVRQQDPTYFSLEFGKGVGGLSFTEVYLMGSNWRCEINALEAA